MDLDAVCACLVGQNDSLSYSALINSVASRLSSASPAIQFSVQHVSAGMAVSFIQGTAAITLILTPQSAQYSPTVAGLSDNHFSGLSAVEASLLWQLSWELWDKHWWESRSNDVIILSHIARGGKTTTVPGKAGSTVKNRLLVLRDKYGVRTTPGLVAAMLRRGELR
jgi:hypothetical protein